MTYEFGPAAQKRMDSYFDVEIASLLRNKNQRAAFALYAMGILGDAERKSVEPLVARTASEPGQVDALHQRVLHFLGAATWDDHGVRLFAANYGIAAMVQRAPIRYWLVDDTGFLKQGTHSVGVQRQYTGSAGKVTNCQVGVSLSVSTSQAHLPIDFALYLPESWMNDLKRRTEASIPEGLSFQTKPQLALAMITQAVADGIAPGVVLADSAYGVQRSFREGVLGLGLEYGVGITSALRVQVVNAQGVLGPRSSVRIVAERMGRSAFRRITWREGTRRKMESRFAFVRVMVPGQSRRQLLVIEWPRTEAIPTRYFLCTFDAGMTQRDIVRGLKERYRTEQVYEELKGELGLDHYEGRKYPGWHHHISVVLSCYAFVLAEREQAFPPSEA